MKEGDIVKLKSGGPRMVIDHVGEYSQVRCLWIDRGSHIQSYIVHKNCLEEIIVKKELNGKQ